MAFALILTVLHDIPDDAEIIKVSTTTFGSERFLESDLHIVNVFAIPHLAEENVGETHGHDVLDHFLAEVMINAVNLLLTSLTCERLVTCDAQEWG